MDGTLESVKGAGYIRTKAEYGPNFQLHVEWASPVKVEGVGQGRGNSGVFLMNDYELQVLDSYETDPSEILQRPVAQQPPQGMQSRQVHRQDRRSEGLAEEEEISLVPLPHHNTQTFREIIQPFHKGLDYVIIAPRTTVIGQVLRAWTSVATSAGCPKPAR